MEALKASIVEKINTNNKDNKLSWHDWDGCETSYIWQKEVKTLKAKLDKALQPKITFSIDRSNFRSSMINPYKKYNYEIKDPPSKSNLPKTLTCLYCCKRGHTISKCRFRRFLVPQGIFKWLPK